MTTTPFPTAHVSIPRTYFSTSSSTVCAGAARVRCANGGSRRGVTERLRGVCGRVPVVATTTRRRETYSTELTDVATTTRRRATYSTELTWPDVLHWTYSHLLADELASAVWLPVAASAAALAPPSPPAPGTGAASVPSSRSAQAAAADGAGGAMRARVAVGEGAARASAKDTLYFALTESIGGEYARQVSVSKSVRSLPSVQIHGSLPRLCHALTRP